MLSFIINCLAFFVCLVGSFLVGALFGVKAEEYHNKKAEEEKNVDSK